MISGKRQQPELTRIPVHLRPSPHVLPQEPTSQVSHIDCRKRRAMDRLRSKRAYGADDFGMSDSTHVQRSRVHQRSVSRNGGASLHLGRFSLPTDLAQRIFMLKYRSSIKVSEVKEKAVQPGIQKKTIRAPRIVRLISARHPQMSINDRKGDRF